jgi:hypothetical protein
MNDESRQLVLRRARLGVISETIARLRKERALMLAEPLCADSSSWNTHRIDAEDAPIGVTVQVDFGVGSPR